MSETERPASSGGTNPLEDAAVAFTETVFDATERLLKAQHEVASALLSGPRPPRATGEDDSSERDETQQAAAPESDPDKFVEAGTEDAASDRDDDESAAHTDSAEQVADRSVEDVEDESAEDVEGESAEDVARESAEDVEDRESAENVEDARDAEIARHAEDAENVEDSGSTGDRIEDDRDDEGGSDKIRSGEEGSGPVAATRRTSSPPTAAPAKRAVRTLGLAPPDRSRAGR